LTCLSDSKELVLQLLEGIPKMFGNQTKSNYVSLAKALKVSVDIFKHYGG